VKIKQLLPGDSTRLADEVSLLVTDIIVELADHSIANVEIQKIGYHFPGQRSACYSADLLLRQYKRLRDERKKNFNYKDVQNVYTIIFFENSTKEFHDFPNTYLHYFIQKSDTGLELNLLQKYYFIPLDIFRKNSHNKSINTDLDAWLIFLTTDEPEMILKLIKTFPVFREMYQDIYAKKKYAEMNVDLASGRLAMFVMEDFNIAKQFNTAAEANGKEAVKDWTIVPLPEGPNATEDYVYGFVEGNFVVSSTENPQGAFNYIIAKHTFDEKYAEVDPNTNLEYWVDDECDQMLADLQPRVFEGLWAGVANVFSNQWGLWEDLRAGKKEVSEIIETYTPFFEQQCEIENANRK